MGILDRIKDSFDSLFGKTVIKTKVDLTSEEKRRKKILLDQYDTLRNLIKLNEKKFYHLLELVKNQEINPDKFEKDSIKLVNETQKINGQILAAKHELSLLGVTPDQLEARVGA